MIQSIFYSDALFDLIKEVFVHLSIDADWLVEHGINTGRVKGSIPIGATHAYI